MRNCSLKPPLGLLGQSDGLAVGANKIELTADELAGVSDWGADEGTAHCDDLSPPRASRNNQVVHRAALNVLELERGRDELFG